MTNRIKYKLFSIILGIMLFIPGNLYSQLTCIRLKKVDFSDNITLLEDTNRTIKYEAPHWLDNNGDGTIDKDAGDKRHPVCYVSGKTIKIKAKFILTDRSNKVTGTLPAGVEVYAMGRTTQGFQFKKQKLTDLKYAETVALNDAGVAKPFQKEKVDYIENLKITWYVTFDSMAPEKDLTKWTKVGISNNSIYVTYKGSKTKNLFHTVVHIGCSTAVGQIGPKEIVNKAYSAFTNQCVSKPNSTFCMRYWYKIEPYNKATSVEEFSSEWLLHYNWATCGSWAAFFIDIVKAQGIGGVSKVSVYPKERIRVWGQPNPRIIYQTENKVIAAAEKAVKRDTTLGKWDDYEVASFGKDPHKRKYLFFVKEFNVSADDSFGDDLKGLAGQGNVNPRAWFKSHAIVKYDGKYYDPSYGTPIYDKPIKWEDASIAGFGVLLKKKDNTGKLFYFYTRDKEGQLETDFK